MIDSREPKDGDFVEYVDKLVRMPRGATHPMAGGAPGEVARETKPSLDGPNALIEGLRRILIERTRTPGGGDNTRTPSGGDTAWGPGGRDATASPAPGAKPAPLAPRTIAAPQRARAGAANEAAVAISRTMRRIASLAIFAGVVLLAMSFADDPPLEIDPIVGIALLVGAAVLKRIAKGIA